MLFCYKLEAENDITVYKVELDNNKPARLCTDKKENIIFLIYKEILKGAVAKSFMTNGLLIYMAKCLLKEALPHI
jgi:hypothetical protein